MVVTGIGLTRSSEISDPPSVIRAGNTNSFHLAIGTAQGQSFRVMLVCDEDVTRITKGPIPATAHQRVREQELFRRDNFRRFSPARRFETQVAMEVSEGAMHSFKSANNQIGWKIFVGAKSRENPTMNEPSW